MGKYKKKKCNFNMSQFLYVIKYCCCIKWKKSVTRTNTGLKVEEICPHCPVVIMQNVFVNSHKMSCCIHLFYCGHIKKKKRLLKELELSCHLTVSTITLLLPCSMNVHGGGLYGWDKQWKLWEQLKVQNPSNFPKPSSGPHWSLYQANSAPQVLCLTPRLRRPNKERN